LFCCSGDKRGSWAPPAAHTGREMLAPPSAHKRDSVARDHLAVPVSSHREYHVPQQGQQPPLIHGTYSCLTFYGYYVHLWLEYTNVT